MMLKDEGFDITVLTGGESIRRLEGVKYVFSSLFKTFVSPKNPALNEFNSRWA